LSRDAMEEKSALSLATKRLQFLSPLLSAMRNQSAALSASPGGPEAGLEQGGWTRSGDNEGLRIPLAESQS
jgi:hypothetical protein